MYDFNLVQVLVQYLLLQSLLEVTTPLEKLEDFKFNVYAKKEYSKLFLTVLFSLSYFIQFSFVTSWFC